MCHDIEVYSRLISLLVYEILLLALLLYFSFKNSQISQLRAHAEEGQAGTRGVIAIAIFNFVVFGLFGILLSLDPMDVTVEMFFWLQVISTSVIPTLFVAVIFIPKVRS